MRAAAEAALARAAMRGMKRPGGAAAKLLSAAALRPAHGPQHARGAQPAPAGEQAGASGEQGGLAAVAGKSGAGAEAEEAEEGLVVTVDAPVLVAAQAEAAGGKAGSGGGAAAPAADRAGWAAAAAALVAEMSELRSRLAGLQGSWALDAEGPTGGSGAAQVSGR
jgi:hypothetical protein